MHINNAPIIHEETISPPQQLPGLLFAQVLPGCSAKALPSNPALPSRATGISSLPGEVPAPRFSNQQLSWHRQPQHSASALSLAAALPICYPSCCQNPPVEPGSRGEELQPRDNVPVAANRQVSSERSRLLSLQVPSTGVREPAEPPVLMLRRAGGNGFPSKPQPRASSRSRASSASTPLEGESPSPSGQTEELPRGVWTRTLVLQTRAAQPPSSAEHGEVCRCLHCKLPGGGGSPGWR